MPLSGLERCCLLAGLDLLGRGGGEGAPLLLELETLFSYPFSLVGREGGTPLSLLGREGGTPFSLSLRL